MASIFSAVLRVPLYLISSTLGSECINQALDKVQTACRTTFLGSQTLASWVYGPAEECVWNATMEGVRCITGSPYLKPLAATVALVGGTLLLSKLKPAPSVDQRMKSIFGFDRSSCVGEILDLSTNEDGIINGDEITPEIIQKAYVKRLQRLQNHLSAGEMNQEKMEFIDLAHSILNAATNYLLAFPQGEELTEYEERLQKEALTTQLCKGNTNPPFPYEEGCSLFI